MTPIICYTDGQGQYRWEEQGILKQGILCPLFLVWISITKDLFIDIILNGSKSIEVWVRTATKLGVIWSVLYWRWVVCFDKIVGYYNPLKNILKFGGFDRRAVISISFMSIQSLILSNNSLKTGSKTRKFNRLYALVVKREQNFFWKFISI